MLFTVKTKNLTFFSFRCATIGVGGGRCRFFARSAKRRALRPRRRRFSGARSDFVSRSARARAARRAGARASPIEVTSGGLSYCKFEFVCVLGFMMFYQNAGRGHACDAQVSRRYTGREPTYSRI